MTYEFLDLDGAGPIGRLVLNRPERRNALSLACMREILRALDTVAADPAIRVLVIEGAGPAFSAGHDLAEMTGEHAAAFYEELFATCVQMMTRVHELPQPVIAKVHGVATAAGCQLVASCDLAVAASDARFATPGVNIGLFCSTPMVPVARSIGPKRALEMLLTGDMIDAPTALDWGLVNEVVPPDALDDAATDLATRIARSSAAVLALGKRAFYAQDQLPEAGAYAITEAVMVENAQGPDAQEGMRAFLEKAGAAVAEPVIDPVDGATVPARKWAKPFAPFKHSAYTRLWSGAFVSNIGTWMESVALGIYVTKLTDQAFWAGAVASAAFVPIAFFGPIGGALADRFARKWMLIITSLVQLLLASLLTLLFATGNPSAPVVTLIALGNGVCAGIGFPAFQAILPDLVPVEDLPGAIALSSAQYNLGRVVGPVLASIVIGFGGYAWAEGINAFSFLAVVAVLLTLTLPLPDPTVRAAKIWATIVEGFRFVKREPGLRVNALAMCVNTFLAAPFIALVPAMAVKVFDNATFGTGLLITAQGIGAVGMALALGGLVARFRARRVLLVMMGWLPLALTLYAFAPHLALSAVALFFVGALYLGALSTFTTIAQLRSPANIRGRVLSVHTMILGALYPVGALIQGELADRIGLRLTTFLSAVGLATAMLLARLVRPGITRAIDEPVAIVSVT